MLPWSTSSNVGILGPAARRMVRLVRPGAACLWRRGAIVDFFVVSRHQSGCNFGGLAKCSGRESSDGVGGQGLPSSVSAMRSHCHFRSLGPEVIDQPLSGQKTVRSDLWRVKLPSWQQLVLQPSTNVPTQKVTCWTECGQYSKGGAFTGLCSLQAEVQGKNQQVSFRAGLMEDKPEPKRLARPPRFLWSHANSLTQAPMSKRDVGRRELKRYRHLFVSTRQTLRPLGYGQRSLNRTSVSACSWIGHCRMHQEGH
eukprot:s1962_g12.t1